MSAKDKALRKFGKLASGIEYEDAGRGKVGYLKSDGAFDPNPSLNLSAGLIWVLLEGERSSVIAIPKGVSLRNSIGFDVKLMRNRITRELYAFLDVERAAVTVGYEAAVALSQPDSVGDFDNSVVDQRRLKPGRLYAPAGDLVFRVRGFWYRDSNGARKWWNDKIQDSNHEVDFTANLPASSNQHKLVVVSLNPDATTPALAKTAGSDVSTSTTLAEDAMQTLLASVNSAYYPLYVVELVNGDTAIPEKRITPVQEIINNPAPPSIDASVVTYTPDDTANWDSSADPGNANDALDQLAARAEAIETAIITGAVSWRLAAAPTELIHGGTLTETSTSWTPIDATNLAYVTVTLAVGEIARCVLIGSIQASGTGGLNFEVDQPTSGNVYVFTSDNGIATRSPDIEAKTITGLFTATEAGVHGFRPVWKAESGFNISIKNAASGLQDSVILFYVEKHPVP